MQLNPIDFKKAVQLTDSSSIELELYPLLLRLLRHSTPSNDNGPAWNGQSWNTIVGGYGAAALGIIVHLFHHCVGVFLIVFNLQFQREDMAISRLLPNRLRVAILPISLLSVNWPLSVRRMNIFAVD